MPKITANSVAEHVAEKEAEVFGTAIRLFVERGYDNVSIADIATEIGLKRNSLYRYFPDKAHILLRWFRQELPRQAEASRVALEGDGPAKKRVEAWALDQIGFAASPEHELIARIGSVIPELDYTTRAELATSHELVLRPLLETLDAAGIANPVEQRVVANMLGDLVGAAARESTRGDEAARIGREYLLRGVRGLLSGARCGPAK